jgi:hypothetical protein
MIRRLLVLATLVALAIPHGAHAFALVKIREVYAGPNGQYVMLQLAGSNQGDVAGKSVYVFGPTGTLGGTFTFATSFANDVSQATILVGTSEVASAPLGVMPDLAMTAVIDPAGGKICFDLVDCMGWGSFSGSTAGLCDTAEPPDCSLAPAIPSGKALRRKIDAGNPALLELFDDTGVSANDFEVVDPNPIDNGTIPTTTTTTTTNTTGTGVTTTEPGGSTTSTTLGCAPIGIDGARCVLAKLPPSDCATDDVPPRIPRFASAARKLLDRAEEATKDTRRLRLVKRSAGKLSKASTASAKAGDKNKVSPDCAGALRGLFDDARGRLTALLPASSSKDTNPR